MRFHLEYNAEINVEFLSQFNYFEDVVCKVSAILFRPVYVDRFLYDNAYLRTYQLSCQCINFTLGSFRDSH